MLIIEWQADTERIVGPQWQLAVAAWTDTGGADRAAC